MDNTFGDQTNVYRVANKMFALVNVDPGDSFTVKVIPEDGEALRATYPFILPGYYMNKRHWVTIELVKAAPPKLLRELIEDSYQLVFASLPRRTKTSLKDL